jgi:predicted dehydrogenase
MLLEYQEGTEYSQTQELKPKIPPPEIAPESSRPVVGLIGAGNFASRVLIPALHNSDIHLDTISSAGGTSAVVTGKKFGFSRAATDYQAIFETPEINTIFIATRHNLHADLVVQSLQAGKNVFVEKPLALNREELQKVKVARNDFPEKQLMVGFNRRFSPLAVKMGELLSGRTQPVTMIYTVNAGHLPPEHWTQDLEQGGGRIIGEACHMIDFLRFLTGERIVQVQAQMIGGTPGPQTREDKMTISLKFEDGSIGTVHYFANGALQYPKERVEVFSEGRILCLNNFRSLRGYGWPGFKSKRLRKQDKGHQEELRAFIERITTGGKALIPWHTLEEVTLASFLAVENAHKNQLDHLALDE